VLTRQESALRPFGRRTAASRALPYALPNAGWKAVGALALICSGVAWASLPSVSDIERGAGHEWHALAIAPLSAGGRTGLRMDATPEAEPVAYVPKRAAAAPVPVPAPPPVLQSGPSRIRGEVGDGLYWSLRAAGASPAAAAQYLSALATEIDVGEVAIGDRFDLVLGGGTERPLLYAGLDRAGSSHLQLVRWNSGGRDQWIDAAEAERPTTISSGPMAPVNGRITSYFGNRMHPILRFTRFHAGVDFGASWGSPIVATADGQVVRAGWSGGYGRQVRIAHGGGLVTSYSHMSSILAQPGSFVHAGQVIGYVGSSGLSTGPHLHYEVLRDGTPINPLGVHFTSVQTVDVGVVNAVKARLKALLSVGVRKG